MKRGYISLFFVFLACSVGWISCGTKEGETEDPEDLAAKQLLQGIWVNEDTDMPFMHVKGDTVFYPDATNMPTSFFIKHDTLFMVGVDTVPYRIDLQTEARFHFHQFEDNIINLYRSEEDADSLSFQEKQEPLPLVSEKVEKDSIVMFDGKRYRGYVFVNPSKMKVIRTSIGPSGMLVDNVYYDNVIHICVYAGATELYGKDFTKRDFSSVIPADFLEGSILADMNFTGVDAEGYHYLALVGPPESPASAAYEVELTIRAADNQLLIELAE